MRPIGIVILNFLAYEETIKCIESIKRQSFQNFSIAVVDNASWNESFQVLENYVAADEKITLIREERNIGFAKGNNHGIRVLKEKGIYNILVINGDTILTDPLYLEKFATLKYGKDWAMIGTKILDLDGLNHNPYPVLLKDKGAVLSWKKIHKRTLFLSNIRIQPLINKFVRHPRLPHRNDKGEEVIRELDLEREMLHGAALFFTENYLKKYSGFYPDTFLYLEEDFLNLICRKLQLKQVYLADISILHKQEASAELEYGSASRKSFAAKQKLLIADHDLYESAFNLSSSELEAKMIESDERK